jgi:hypothetical protein
MKSKFLFPLLFLSLACTSYLFTSAQDRDQKVDLRPLLFKKFLKADILKKDGSSIQASVNYNTDNQSLIFLTKDEYMELTGLDEIDQIKVDSDVFVPIDGKIYEKTDRKDLFISYTNKVVVNDIVSSQRGSELKDARESSNMVSNVYVSRVYKSPNDLEFVKKFWIMKEGNLVEITNLKKLSKAFNISKNELNEFVKEHNINFNNYSDITELLNYVVAKN